MKVEVLFFGVLAEKAGTDIISIEDAEDLKGLEKLIKERYPEFGQYTYKTSVNRVITGKNEILKDGDEVAFMPPFAGG